MHYTTAADFIQTAILIYADGSCIPNPGPGGYASTLRRYENGVEVMHATISGHELETTNNRMELMAAIAALECLRKDETAPIIFRSDSQLLIHGMTDWLPNWLASNWKAAGGKPVKNADLWRLLVELATGRNITWQWVKGHAGDPMNEEVDQLAKAEAATARAKRFIA